MRIGRPPAGSRLGCNAAASQIRRRIRDVLNTSPSAATDGFLATAWMTEAEPGITKPFLSRLDSHIRSHIHSHVHT